MESFSDEDLKKLKAEAVEHDSGHCGPECDWHPFDIPALIARLEAAEAVIAEADQNGFSDKAIALETAWRKAAGK